MKMQPLHKSSSPGFLRCSSGLDQGSTPSISMKNCCKVGLGSSTWMFLMIAMVLLMMMIMMMNYDDEFDYDYYYDDEYDDDYHDEHKDDDDVDNDDGGGGDNDDLNLKVRL